MGPFGQSILVPDFEETPSMSRYACCLRANSANVKIDIIRACIFLSELDSTAVRAVLSLSSSQGKTRQQHSVALLTKK